MAVAFDAASNAGAFVNQTNFSWSHTCTGNNLVLFVAITSQQAYAPAAPAVTYNGVSMTVIDHDDQDAQGGFTATYYLLNPPTGTHTIALTASAGGISTGAAISLTGVKQSAQPEAHGTNDVTGNPSKSITTVTDRAWIIGAVASNSYATGFNFSGATPGTEKVNIHTDVLGTGNALAMQIVGPVTPAGATTVGWTQNGTGEHELMLAAFTSANQDYVLSMTNGSFTLTGFAATFKKAWLMMVSYGAFILTGFASLLHKIATITQDSRHTGTMTPDNRTSPSLLTQDNKSSSTLTQDNRTP